MTNPVNISPACMREAERLLAELLPHAHSAYQEFDNEWDNEAIQIAAKSLQQKDDEISRLRIESEAERARGDKYKADSLERDQLRSLTIELRDALQKVKPSRF